LQKCAVRFDDADLGRQPDVLERVLTCRARAPIVARNVDDVRVGFGDADRDHADAGDDGQFDRHFDARIAGFEFFDELRQVFDRVDIVVVAGRDQVNAFGGITRRRDLLGNLFTGQVPPFTGLRTLPDFDLQQIR
jgi:hypothetical protein